MALISISIDISGSTALKYNAHKITNGDHDSIRANYEAYLKHFYFLEGNFYSSILNHGLDINNLFVPKVIGDEVWIVYDLKGITKNNSEFNQVCTAILESAFDTLSKSDDVTLLSRRLTTEEDVNGLCPDDVKTLHRKITPKVYIDLIEDLIGISDIRLDYFERNILPKLASLPVANPTSSDMDRWCEVAGRLNVGICTNRNQKKLSVSHRFDAIGFDVDRFIIYAGNALPGLICCGDRLLSSLWKVDALISVENTIDKLSIPLKIDSHGSRFWNKQISMRFVTLPRPGVDETYQVYYLFDKPQLNEIRHLCERFPDLALSKTKKYIDGLKS